MRMFWNQAAARGFERSETVPLKADQMKDLLAYADSHREVATIESGCEHDSVFDVSGIAALIGTQLPF